MKTTNRIFIHNAVSICNIAILMIIIVGLISILSSIQLLCNLPLKFPLSILATSIIISTLVYKGIFQIMECIISVLCSLLFCIVSSHIFDFTWDGQAYHQLSILMFAEGWNPYWDSEKINTYFDDIWVYGYPKAFWIFSASIYELTHNVLIGKAYNLILTASSLLLCYEAYKQYFPKHKLLTSSLAFLTTFNPIVVCQLLTYYIDSTLYLLIIDMVTISYLWIIKKQNIYLFTLSIIIILICNTKFTGAVYAVIICLTILAIIMISHHFLIKKLLFTMLFSGAIGIFIIGYNPYITNYIRHGNIGWPIMGNDKIDIVTPQGPNNLVKKDRLQKLIISNNSFAHNDNKSEPILKFPCQIGKYEYLVYGSPDVRIGGFGPLYNIIFIYTIVMLVILLSNKKIQIREKILIIGLFISILSNPECWWARYIPQLYFLSLIVILISYKSVDIEYLQHFYKYICKICIVILFFNYLLVSAGYIRNFKSNIERHSANIERLKSVYRKSGKPLYVHFYKLDSRILSIFQVNDIKIFDSRKQQKPKGYILVYKDNNTDIYMYNKE